MLDPAQLREHSEVIAQRLAQRGYTLDIKTYTNLEAERRQTDMTTQKMQGERRQASKRIGELVREGIPIERARQQQAEALKKISAQLERLETKNRQIHGQLESFLAEIPNIPDEQAPAGLREEDNKELLRWGQPRAPDGLRDHVALGAENSLNFERATSLAGARFSVLEGSLAQLHRALGQFMIELHTEVHAYREIYVPYLANAQALFGTGQLPKFEADLFRTQDESAYYLIPTGEVPLSNLFRDRILEAEELATPLRYVCHSPCFRREAGSYGRDVRGLIRQHQFDKVELVQGARGTDAKAALESMCSHAEEVLKRLELPYRKVALCAGELGFSACRGYDLEVWMAAGNRYLEISSCSDCGDFQARRMMARWRNPDSGRTEYLHTLNGSGVAVGRCLAALMEQHQCPDGSIAVPPALRPYMRGAHSIRPGD